MKIVAGNTCQECMGIHSSSLLANEGSIIKIDNIQAMLPGSNSPRILVML